MFVCLQRIALPRRMARQYPAYGLYLYGEGQYAQDTRGLKLTGAPVLFLPGNAGSYKQGEPLPPLTKLIHFSNLLKSNIPTQLRLGNITSLLSPLL